MSDGLDPILQQKEQQQLKTQLLWRLGIAGALIAAILGGIAWLEKSQDNAPPKVDLPQIAPEISASEMASLNASEPSTASTASAAATSAPSPTPTANPSAAPTAAPTATPIPTAAATPLASARPSAAPAVRAGQTALPPGVQMTGNSSPRSSQRIENIPVATSIPKASITPKAIPALAATAIPLKAITAAPSSTALPSTTLPSSAPRLATAAPATYPAPVSNSRGYSVQAGVFLLSNNAEKLLGQLQQAGIPAYLETRVQIGPFKNKAEAEAAVRKLKAMGITPVVKTE
ncbi:SPOR domain-containing protein [Chitinibacter tainanensis]|uniref:SPOR domain-containing protein n=1 Tax=Chitinibacter tainanensis TaxID=230667 RepID=UPI0004259250|nr:SPOR domain-containing protein [Chitinibacter tainanensis]